MALWFFILDLFFLQINYFNKHQSIELKRFTKKAQIPKGILTFL